MGLLKNSTVANLQNYYTTFQSVENTLSEVVVKIKDNPRLQKLLYYTDKHALSLPQLNQEQVYGLLNHQIKVIPQLDIEADAKPYVVIGLDNYTPYNGSMYRQIVLTFDILCPYQYWMLDDFKLRPYSIAGEIDALINKSSLIKGGMADFVGAKQLMLSPDLGGLVLYYKFDVASDDVEMHSTEEMTSYHD